MSGSWVLWTSIAHPVETAMNRLFKAVTGPYLARTSGRQPSKFGSAAQSSLSSPNAVTAVNTMIKTDGHHTEATRLLAS